MSVHWLSVAQWTDTAPAAHNPMCRCLEVYCHSCFCWGCRNSGKLPHLGRRHSPGIVHGFVGLCVLFVNGIVCAIRVLLLQCMLWLRQVCVHGRGQTRPRSNLQGTRAGTLPNVGSATNAYHPQHVQWSCNCSPAVDSKHCALTSATRYRARPAAIQCELRQSSTAVL